MPAATSSTSTGPRDRCASARRGGDEAPDLPGGGSSVLNRRCSSSTWPQTDPYGGLDGEVSRQSGNGQAEVIARIHESSVSATCWPFHPRRRPVRLELPGLRRPGAWKLAEDATPPLQRVGGRHPPWRIGHVAAEFVAAQRGGEIVNAPHDFGRGPLRCLRRSRTATTYWAANGVSACAGDSWSLRRLSRLRGCASRARHQVTDLAVRSCSVQAILPTSYPSGSQPPASSAHVSPREPVHDP